MFTLAAFGVFVVSAPAGNTATSDGKSVAVKFERTAPEQKRFVLTVNYPYRERVYDPPVLVKKLRVKPEGRQMIAENILISHISAMKNLDFDWWLDTWTAAERPAILKQLEAAGKTKEDLLEEWKNTISKSSVLIKRWIIARKYIILTYTTSIQDPNNKSKVITSKEIPVTFKFSDLRWNITQELENDPVVLYFNAGTSRIERVIR